MLPYTSNHGLASVIEEAPKKECLGCKCLEALHV